MELINKIKNITSPTRDSSWPLLFLIFFMLGSSWLLLWLNDWDKGEIISAMSLIVALFLTAGIYQLDKNAEKRKQEQELQAEALQKKYSTLTWANSCFIEIDKAVGEKAMLEKQNIKKPIYDYKTISELKYLIKPVFMVLNQYSAIGTAWENNLLDLEVVKQLRGDAILKTWNQYEAYIAEYRIKEKTDVDDSASNAWVSFENLARELTYKKKK